MGTAASADLRRLEAMRDAFGDGRAAERLALLERLARARLPAAGEVLRLHEILCFWRAYPEDARLLQQVESMLAAFHLRADLRRHRRDLFDSGMAGTDLYFRFYWLMAIRLVERWPESLSIDWADFGEAPRLVEMLHLLLPYSETPALDSLGFSAPEWIQSLKGDGETDATFLIRRFAALPVPRPAREHLYEKLDIPVRLSPGEATPARGREKWPRARVVHQRRPLSRGRPRLRQAVADASFRIRSLNRSQGREIIELANAAMIPRHRDLLVFLHADAGDVRVVDFGDGHQFACIGTRPDRRLLLEAVYGFLTLKNGVPIGYVLNSALFGSCELAFNVFDSFRGAEAGVIYSRFLAAVHRLFDADAFTIDPYQLGHGNREGQLSGAWWFYYKFGFRPRDPAIRALVREELARMRRSRTYRTPPARLNRLAADNMYFHLGRQRPDILGRVSLGNIGLAVSRYLARRFGHEREKGLRICAREAAHLLGSGDPRRLAPGPRLAWERWSPLVLALPGVPGWTRSQKRALAGVIRAKGGRRESDFVRRFDAHPRLRQALLRLAAHER